MAQIQTLPIASLEFTKYNVPLEYTNILSVVNEIEA